MKFRNVGRGGIWADMKFELSFIKKQLACFLEGGRRRLSVHHLTLLAHHSWTLNVKLTVCVRRRAQYFLIHPLCAPGAIFPQRINFLINTTIPIASTCSWNSLLLLGGSMSIHRSIGLSLQRDGRGDGRGARVGSVPEAMTSVFQVWLGGYEWFLHRFWACERYVSDLQMTLGIDEKNTVFAPKFACFPACFPSSVNFQG